MLQDLAICPKFLAVPALVSPLKLAIVASGKTQREVAAAAGTDEYRLSRIVNGREVPPPDLRSALADVVGVPVSQLWPAQDLASDQISDGADGVGRQASEAAA